MADVATDEELSNCGRDEEVAEAEEAEEAEDD